MPRPHPDGRPGSPLDAGGQMSEHRPRNEGGAERNRDERLREEPSTLTAPLVVMGDVMLDIDKVGRSERLSPEAPVPVLRDLTEHRRPGGAALAALLAAHSGPRPVVLIAPLASDAAAAEIRDMLAGQVEVLPLPWTGSTPIKTRLRVGDHPLARIDEGGDLGDVGDVPGRVASVLAGAAAVLVADYGRGLTADARLRTVLTAAARRVPVVWDPHPHGARPVDGVALATPNEAELNLFVSAPAGAEPYRAERHGLAAVHHSARQLAALWQARSVCVTLGSRGAMLCGGDNSPFMVGAQSVGRGDTCGAGDSFAVAAALAFAAGALPSEAVVQAVAQAGRFVAAGGAAGFDPRPTTPDADPAPSVDALLAEVRRRGGVVVATGGCFDLLHAGHVATLEAARALGDALVVCLNSDSSVSRLKGPTRPLQPATDRARVLLALQAVDAVVVFDQDTPREALEQIRPDIWAKGGDYSGLPLPEADVLADWGGQAVIVPYLQGRSTTALVDLASQPAAAR